MIIHFIKPNRTMTYLGLLIELLLFGLGVYFYLFARGIITVKDQEQQARAEAFRRDNATWMRLAGLALAAIMLVNIVLHLAQLLG